MLTKTVMRAAAAARPSPVAALRSMNAIRTSSTSSNNSSPVNTTPDEAYQLLVNQRKKRPIAPHLSIYQPQLTWYMSGANRITGLFIAAPVYLFGLAYAASPVLGLHLESATMAATFAALPLAAKLAFKTTLALPFTYHALNGVRHLTWDTGKFVNNQGVYNTGYAVLGLTALATGYVAFAL